MIRVTNVFKNQNDAQADFMKERATYGDRMEKEGMDKFKKDPKIQAQMKTDTKAIEDYLAANHIQAYKTKWGTFVQIINPGQGPKPELGKFSMLRYSRKHMNGEVFDENVGP